MASRLSCNVPELGQKRAGSLGGSFRERRHRKRRIEGERRIEKAFNEKQTSITLKTASTQANCPPVILEKHCCKTSNGTHALAFESWDRDPRLLLDDTECFSRLDFHAVLLSAPRWKQAFDRSLDTVDLGSRRHRCSLDPSFTFTPLSKTSCQMMEPFSVELTMSKSLRRSKGIYGDAQRFSLVRRSFRHNNEPLPLSRKPIQGSHSPT